MRPPSGSGMQRFMLRAIESYQRAFAGRPSPCRFYPTCSVYGHEAISRFGAGRGLWLTVRRLSRCRPLGPSGFDPVPLAAGHDEHPQDAHDASPRTPRVPGDVDAAATVPSGSTETLA